MQVERHAQRFDDGPEARIRGIVVIDDFFWLQPQGTIGTRPLREAIDQRALEPELLDAARQLACGRVRILHRQRGEAGESIGTPGDGVGKRLVGATRRSTATRRRNRWIAEELRRGIASAIPWRSIRKVGDRQIDPLRWRSVHDPATRLARSRRAFQ